MDVPALSPPTNEIALISSWVHKCSTVGRAPWTTCNKLGGNPASAVNWASNNAQPGVCSDGFKRKAFPAVIASGNIHKGIIAGKLNGQMPAHTPSGKRYEMVSIVVDKPIMEEPSNCDEIWQAASTTSSPRWMSPMASAVVLPFSIVMSVARSFILFRINAWYWNMMRCRCCTDTSFHSFCASFALAIMLSHSSLVFSGTCAINSCVDGLRTLMGKSSGLPLFLPTAAADTTNVLSDQYLYTFPSPIHGTSETVGADENVRPFAAVPVATFNRLLLVVMVIRFDSVCV